MGLFREQFDTAQTPQGASFAIGLGHVYNAFVNCLKPSYAVGDLLYAGSATEFERLADVATGNALISGGVAAAPSWGKIDLTAHVSGALPFSNIAAIATGRLLGRDTTGLGNIEALTVSGGLEFTGSGGIRVAETITAGGPTVNASTVPVIIYNGRGQLTAVTTASIAIAASAVTGADLTRTNDSNVTLTLGGTPTGALLKATSITVGWSGTLAVVRGGLGFGTTAQGDILYADAANSLARLAKNTTASRYLSNTGTSNNPAWSQVDLSNGVTGDLPFSNLTQGSALSVLGVAGNASADHASIAAGSDHQVLRRSGTAVAFGAVNLAQSAAVTGTLPVGNGGTGVTSITDRAVPIGRGTSAIEFASPGSAGAVLMSNGPSSNPSFQSLKTFFNGNAGGGTPAGTTVFLAHGANAAEANVSLIFPVTGTLKNLRVATGGAPGVGQTYTFTARVNNADTSIVATISGAAANTAADTTNSAPIGAGVRFSVKLVTSAGAAVTGGAVWSIEFDSP